MAYMAAFGQVRWNNDESTGALNFYSISSDGRVSNWQPGCKIIQSIQSISIGSHANVLTFGSTRRVLDLPATEHTSSSDGTDALDEVLAEEQA